MLVPARLHGAVVREEGAHYLEDFLEQPLTAWVRSPVRIYYALDFRRVLGELRAPQEVEVQAAAGDRLRVRGKARQGQVAGWIPAESVSGLPKDFFASVAKAAERHAQVSELIERNEVAMGMSVNEVMESLGRPEKKSARVDDDGHRETWEYIRYERVPQTVTRYDQFGRLIQETIYVKVPSGRLAVEFIGGVVAAIEQSEGTLTPGRVRVVVPPLSFY